MLYIAVFGDGTFTTFYASSDPVAETRARALSAGHGVRYVARVIAN